MHNYLYDGRSNVGIPTKPSSMLSQGDLPTKLAAGSIPEREIEVSESNDGCISEGVSLCKGMYQPENDDDYPIF